MGFHYVARKRMKVAGRTVEPGEVVPEAAAWRNVQAYIDNGSLAVALPGGSDTAAMAGLEARIVALEARLNGVPTQAGEGDGSEDDSDTDTAPPDPGGDDAAPTGDDAESFADPIDLNELEGIRRDALDAQAIALGIADAPKLANKQAVATAINAARGA